jgi:hypothetical protein
MVETCPRDLSFAAVLSAASRSVQGPMRTRYRKLCPEPPDDTNAVNPCALSWCTKLSALARLAKLPNCTAQRAADMGEGAGVSTGAAAAGEAAVFGAAAAAAEALGPGLPLCAPGAVPPAGGGTATGGSASDAAGALLVAKSTVTVRMGSAAIAFGAGGAVAGFGPDNNSGTTSTTIATNIDAPMRRSLTRRSII